jgi:para-nitrobenzyl esterase
MGAKECRNVTLLGRSAGSWSVNVLVASPLAKGLFVRAIGQSGARFNRSMRTGNSWASAEYLTEDRNGVIAGEKAGLAFAKAAGAKSVKALRAMPTEKIFAVPFRPMEKVDGWVLPAHVRTLYSAARISPELSPRV